MSQISIAKGGDVINELHDLPGHKINEEYPIPPSWNEIVQWAALWLILDVKGRKQVAAFVKETLKASQTFNDRHACDFITWK